MPQWSELVRVVAQAPYRWLAPAGVIALLACLAAALYERPWRATQAVVLRNDAVAPAGSPGTFQHDNAMKVWQETVLELARNRTTLTQTLELAGPPEGARRPEHWPTDDDLDALAGSVNIKAPAGLEFGQNELFYLQVSDLNRDRALVLARSLCEVLDEGVQHVRGEKAQSIEAELVAAEKLAEEELTEATSRLSELERHAGLDLSELRILHAATSDHSDLRRQATELQGELRQVRTRIRDCDTLAALLVAAQADPVKLLSVPAALVDLQPRIKQLQQGLSDGRLRTAQLLGLQKPDHPLSNAAAHAESEIQRQLTDEIANSAAAVASEKTLLIGREALLVEMHQGLAARIERMAGLRAEYTNLVSAVTQRSDRLAETRRKRSDARAALASTASLLNRVGAPATGSHPVGPGRATILFAGLLAGGALGLAAILLLNPQSPSHVSPVADVALPASSASTNYDSVDPLLALLKRRGQDRPSLN